MKRVEDFKAVFIHKEPVDMRKGINGLCDLIVSAQMGDLSEPHLFVFTGKRRDTIKILYFDKCGFCLWQKRLDREKFVWPKKYSDSIISISTEQLNWLLSGYDIWKMKPFSEIKFERVA